MLGTDVDGRCGIDDRPNGLDAVESGLKVETAGVEVTGGQGGRTADACVAVNQHAAAGDKCLANPVDGSIELLDVPFVSVELIHLDHRELTLGQVELFLCAVADVGNAKRIGFAEVDGVLEAAKVKAIEDLSDGDIPAETDGIV